MNIPNSCWLSCFHTCYHFPYWKDNKSQLSHTAEYRKSLYGSLIGFFHKGLLDLHHQCRPWRIHGTSPVYFLVSKNNPLRWDERNCLKSPNLMLWCYFQLVFTDPGATGIHQNPFSPFRESSKFQRQDLEQQPLRFVVSLCVCLLGDLPRNKIHEKRHTSKHLKELRIVGPVFLGTKKVVFLGGIIPLARCRPLRSL